MVFKKVCGIIFMWKIQKPPSEKMIAVIIGFLGISALVLGTLQIQKGIKGPFQKNIAREKDKRNDLDLEQVDKLTELQKKTRTKTA